MNKLYLILLLCSILLFPAVSYAEDDKEPKSVEHYRSEGVTIVAPSEWKPFAYKDVSGEYVGYAMDFWKLWSEKANVPIRFEFRDWPETLKAIKNGEADVHGGVYYSTERSEYMDFSESIYSGISVLAIRDDSPVDCSNAMVGGTVGLVEKSYTAEYVKSNYPEVNGVEFANSKEITMAFLSGEVDAVVTAYPPFILVVREQKAIDSVNICRTIFYRDAYAAVQKGETNLLELLNEGMAEMSSEEIRQMEARWFVPAEEPQRQWMIAVLPAVIVMFLVGGAVILWVSRRR